MAKKKRPAKRAVKKTGTAVAVHRAQTPAQPRTFHETLVEIARDKNIDVAKMQAVLDMRAQENAREAQIAFDADMAEMQPMLPTIKKTGEIVIREKGTDKVLQRTPFAKWEVIQKVITPIMQRYGFALRHHVGNSDDGRVTVKALLTHKNGHREESPPLTLPYDTTGSKNNVQAIGSSISYGKRYTAAAILNLIFEGADDDGMRGGGTIIDQQPISTISPEQIKRLQSAMTKHNIPATRVTDYVSKLAKDNIATVNDIPIEHFDETMRTIEQHSART